ncbi:plasma membrane H+-ATPase [Hypoxylon texense]
MPPPSADSGPASFFPSASDRPASSSTSTVGTTNSSTATARSSSSGGNPSAEIGKALLAGSPHNDRSPDSNASSQPGRDRDLDRVEDHGLLEDQRVKKRRTGPSSRGVANLTPEQLAKKRANDREAQRAIRERTKNQIENLERRIRELTSQQPYQELQAAIRAKEAVEAENAEIKNRLASIMSLIQPMLSNQQAEGAFTSSPPFPNFSPTQTIATQRSPSAPTTYNASTPVSAASPASIADSSWQQSQGQQSQQPSPSFTQVQLLTQQRHELSHNLDLGAGEQLKLDFLLDPSQRVHKIQTGPNGAQDTPDYQHLPMKHDWSAVAVHPSTATSTPMSPSRDCVAVNGGGGGPGPQQQQQQHRIEYAVATTPQEEDMLLLQQNPAAAASWIGTSAPIRNGPPTCPLDSLLLDFLHERRQRAAEGVPPREVVGPRYPSVRSLLNPAHSAYSHPLSKVFTDILAAFPGISGLPERVAVLYYMFLVMRWQVRPTRDNYDLLPPFAVPTPGQLGHAHPAWIDHLPFPRMRDVLAREYYGGSSSSNSSSSSSGGGGGAPESEFLFDNFFIPFTTTISLNWPYEPTDALLQSPDGAELLINPVFERHMRRLENWTLGTAFDEAFPRLRGTYNLKREEERGERTGSSGRNGNGNGNGGGNGVCVDGQFSGG